ncbi:ER membrane glycoprotein subunit of the GPI transamidase complex-like protein [Ophidiomyces ophidiicola]|uniref:ER membrane glycoprotein subunit of the GPI transamidase complex-like protein n=1 Tax=Ophidiomyces ophidiicola TaxID=1387563 RepID=UPI0020C5574C|nr:ER membrane glycoprotein subunit of the GPI transamidase complex-like protein [Ophidiomyces ophidiicola]KAI1944200.1 ER membrane glycoprotein subunit of the GPI transamidase complex-like protein [Ophidiomyces ophidiicola]KAI1944856.1 ER membrane glycoprotein subunit of the GPI transamidase complex-like protein [Ophidiomyces ophidiicola]KAI2041900.1 ER membrane glycoprotein subunit of the GPI transamidase complex-like protein [Ophidiomyces ophidiicola]KAI2050264.1 ER membrane glycoprotein sub
MTPNRPLWTLTCWFAAWKFLVLVLVLAGPGPGYDTSTTILSPIPSSGLSAKLLNFVRWDSLYFVNIAQRGYLYEQEWAFGYGYTKLLAILSTGTPREPFHLAVVGIAVSHLAHYLSVLVLYRLTQTIFGDKKYPNHLPFLSAALHIISPAGAFLSAPYGEPVFALLNILGYYVYFLALKYDRQSSLLPRDLSFIASGCIFAVASTVRSNGILGGMLFAYDAVLRAFEIVQTRHISLPVFRRLVFVGLGGALILLGIAGPQYIAYSSYCQSAASPRSWCSNLPPSIYTWVQGRYWNVGFLGYWTIPNIPLFLMAAPMLTILFLSATWALTLNKRVTIPSDKNTEKMACESEFTSVCLVRLALPQAVLALLALTSYHVQIITRLASGYPLWYWWLAICLFKEGKHGFKGIVQPKTILHGIVLYGMVQAALFASFLPPA